MKTDTTLIDPHGFSRTQPVLYQPARIARFPMACIAAICLLLGSTMVRSSAQPLPNAFSRYAIQLIQTPPGTVPEMGWINDNGLIVAQYWPGNGRMLSGVLDK